MSKTHTTTISQDGVNNQRVSFDDVETTALRAAGHFTNQTIENDEYTTVTVPKVLPAN